MDRLRAIISRICARDLSKMSFYRITCLKVQIDRTFDSVSSKCTKLNRHRVWCAWLNVSATLFKFTYRRNFVSFFAFYEFCIRYSNYLVGFHIPRVIPSFPLRDEKIVIFDSERVKRKARFDFNIFFVTLIRNFSRIEWDICIDT